MKKVISLGMIMILISLSFTIYSPEVEAASINTCAFTNDGDFCVEGETVVRSDCKTGYFYSGRRREQVEDCMLGTCIPNEGKCLAQKSRIECLHNNEGQWTNQPKENVGQCKKGCCNVAGSLCSIEEKKYCIHDLAGDDSSVFDGAIIDEGRCDAVCSSAVVGCYKDENVCTYGAQENFFNLPSFNSNNFYANTFCSKVLGCFATGNFYQSCGDGTTADDSLNVYWFDSSGNREDVSEDCGYPNKFCYDPDGKGGSTAYCKTTSCAEDLKDVEPSDFKTGESLCVGVQPYHYTQQGRSTSIKPYILRCQFGEIKPDDSIKDREVVCIEDREEDGKLHAKVIDNKWDKCSSCGDGGGILGNLGDVFGYLPPVVFSQVLLGLTTKPCKSDVDGFVLRGDDCREKGRSEGIQMCGYGPLAINNDEIKNDYDSDLWDPIGSCNPIYPPSGVDSCGRCGKGGDGILNVCTIDECNALGDCKFVENKNLLNEGFAVVGGMWVASCTSAAIAAQYVGWVPGAKETFLATVASMCSGTLAPLGMKVYSFLFFTFTPIVGSFSTQGTQLDTVKFETSKEGNVMLKDILVFRNLLNKGLNSDPNNIDFSVIGAEGIQLGAPVVVNIYKSLTKGWSVEKAVSEGVKEELAKEVAKKEILARVEISPDPLEIGRRAAEGTIKTWDDQKFYVKWLRDDFFKGKDYSAEEVLNANIDALRKLSIDEGINKINKDAILKGTEAGELLYAQWVKEELIEDGVEISELSVELSDIMDEVVNEVAASEKKRLETLVIYNRNYLKRLSNTMNDPSGPFVDEGFYKFVSEKGEDAGYRSYQIMGGKGTKEEFLEALKKKTEEETSKEATEKVTKKVTEEAVDGFIKNNLRAIIFNSLIKIWSIYSAGQSINPGKCVSETAYTNNENCGLCGYGEGQWYCTEERCDILGGGNGHCKWIQNPGAEYDGKCIPLEVKDANPPKVISIQSSVFDNNNNLILSTEKVNKKQLEIDLRVVNGWRSTNITINFETDEDAVCIYSKTSQQIFVVDDFGEENGYTKQHVLSVDFTDTDKTAGTSFIYLKCMDINENKIEDDSNYVKVLFPPRPDTEPPVIKYIDPIKVMLPENMQNVNIELVAFDEKGVEDCRYSETSEDFNEMKPFVIGGFIDCPDLILGNNKCNLFSTTLNLAQSTPNQLTYEELKEQYPNSPEELLRDLENIKSYFYSISCKDTQGNIMEEPFDWSLIIIPGFEITVNNPTSGESLYNQIFFNISTETNPTTCNYIIDNDKKYNFTEQFLTKHEKVHEGYLTEGVHNVKFKCMDYPGNEAETENIPFNVLVKDLVVTSFEPDDEIFYTNTINMEIKLQGGLYDNGNATCKYGTSSGSYNNEIEDKSTFGNETTYTQELIDLTDGRKKYYVKCMDDFEKAINFDLEFTVDLLSVPRLRRVYTEGVLLSIEVSQESECLYSDENFGNSEFENLVSSTRMVSINGFKHQSALQSVFYIKCKNVNNGNINVDPFVIYP